MSTSSSSSSVMREKPKIFKVSTDGQVYCNHDMVALCRVTGHRSSRPGQPWFGCPLWPSMDCKFFMWKEDVDAVFAKEGNWKVLELKNKKKVSNTVLSDHRPHAGHHKARLSEGMRCDRPLHLHALMLINGLNHLEPMIITQIISMPSNDPQFDIGYLRSIIHHSKHPNVIARTSFIQFLYQHDVESASEIFDEMDEKGHLLYDAMITCYAQNGRLKDALQLFDEMLQPNVNIQPNNMTLATIIRVCSQSGNLIFGSWIHETLMKQMRIMMDDQVSIALVELYAKCRVIRKAFGYKA
ncbi:hypothetical protein QVD17_28301 [Tagetes erecta]|uniref:Uncharacterized protein n=1 Tax=Tagetes erecta TaxID=13708 RepID=A0AAD8KET9_TARER|nr:hypothetical protein QVD17_28301 [Tagetes erecta]